MNKHTHTPTIDQKHSVCSDCRLPIVLIRGYGRRPDYWKAVGLLAPVPIR